MFHKKHLLWKLYRQFRSKELLAKYKQASRLCSNSIVDLIAQHENNLIDNNILCNFYKYINRKLNGSSGIGPLMNSSDVIEHSSHVKATLFTEYFSSVFTVNNSTIDADRLPPMTDSVTPILCFFYTRYSQETY